MGNNITKNKSVVDVQQLHIMDGLNGHDHLSKLNDLQSIGQNFNDDYQEIINDFIELKNDFHRLYNSYSFNSEA
ncbi:hypothetical protein ACG2LH_13865 [Zhouia sp. PK063]|uniref:hypothetical protein n=1 Tax=Zhouia sp. PK063 TaxID=3373602 RepID=UPI00378D26FE